MDGKTYSLMSEAIYENKLKTFTLSAGITTVRNTRTIRIRGDVSSLFTSMHNNHLSVSAGDKGYWGKLRYSAGVGAVTHHRQQEHTYDYFGRFVRRRVPELYDIRQCAVKCFIRSPKSALPACMLSRMP